jgi:glucan biosynthesis protein C
MMLLGVFLHAACGYASLPDIWFFKDRITSIWMDATILVIHLFRMPVFYVMAGFFGALLYSRRGWRGVLKNRAARILAPFLLGLVVFSPILRPMGAYFWFAERRPNPWASTVEYMTSGRWLHRIEPDHMWFLEYLVFLYVIALVMVPVFGRLPLGRAFRTLNRWPLVRVLFWAAITFLTLVPMKFGLLDTPDGFRFEPHIVAA